MSFKVVSLPSNLLLPLASFLINHFLLLLSSQSPSSWPRWPQLATSTGMHKSRSSTVKWITMERTPTPSRLQTESDTKSPAKEDRSPTECRSTTIPRDSCTRPHGLPMRTVTGHRELTFPPLLQSPRTSCELWSTFVCILTWRSPRSSRDSGKTPLRLLPPNCSSRRRRHISRPSPNPSHIPSPTVPTVYLT